MSLLAIDIGSSACKAVAFTPDGEIVAQRTSAYTPSFPEPGHAEMASHLFWDAVCACTKSIAASLPEPIQAVCFSSHGETFVAVNKKGEPVANAILNQDTRATAESNWLEQKLERRRIFEITGLVLHPMYPLAKILWLRRHCPQTFSSSAGFVTPIGYILLRLGLPAYIDYSLASRYLAFDVRARKRSEEILEAAELTQDLLPEPVPAGAIVGKLSASSAAELGLCAGTRIVLGGHDQPCGALGSGVIRPGQVSDSLGTYECALAASEKPALSDTAFAASLNSYCHVVPDKYVTIAFFPSGIMMKWFHDLLYRETRNSDASHYQELEAHAPPGPTGLCITPNLIGSCNPDFNPNLRGIIYGLNSATGPAAIYKGILEGLACELSQITQLLADAVGDFSDMSVSGGGTRSTLGVQLRAALTGKCLHVMRCPEAVCMGGAILAGVAVGQYANFEQAVGQVVREAAVIAPDLQIASVYASQIKRYQWLRSLTPPDSSAAQ